MSIPQAHGISYASRWDLEHREHGRGCIKRRSIPMDHDGGRQNEVLGHFKWLLEPGTVEAKIFICRHNYFYQTVFVMMND